MADNINMINMYEPRIMMAALQQVPRPKRFLHTTFFSETFLHDTEKVDMDIRKGKRRLAHFVHPLSDAKIVERDGFDTVTRKPAYIKEKKALRVSDTRTRAIGENIFNASTPAQRAMQILGEDLVDLDTRNARLEEKSAAEVLFTGKLVIRGEGFNDIIDFGYVDGEHLITLSGTSLWSNPDADILGDLDKWRMMIMKRCGISPNRCIVSHDVGWAIINNPKIQEMLKIDPNYRLGNIAPEYRMDGVSYIGTLRLPTGTVELMIYNEWYTDPLTGEDISLVPEGKMLLGSTEARCAFHYGLIQNFKSLGASSRFPHYWEEPDGSARWVQLESAPMPNLVQPDAFLVATVL